MHGSKFSWFEKKLYLLLMGKFVDPLLQSVHMYIYPALILFEQSNCIDWIKFCCILSLIKIQLFWYPCHMLPVELLETSCKSSSLPVDRKYQKGQSRDD